MYKVEPKGINIKDNDRNVPDGFFQECINLQQKDGTFKPIPARTTSGLPRGYGKYIMHKVGDEDRVNVLEATTDGNLYYGFYILDGNIISRGRTAIPDFPVITDFDSLSFTILNGIIYFMSSSQKFYLKVQYNESYDTYETKDMYDWKSLIPYYPVSGTYTGSLPKGTDTRALKTICGIILIRFTLTLNTGEEVLHTPAYSYSLHSLNTGTTDFAKGTALDNIHTIVNTNLQFYDTGLFNERISSINVYACVPSYVSELDQTFAGSGRIVLFNDDDEKGLIQKMSESPFYLIKTLNSPGTSTTDKALLLYAGNINQNLDYGLTSYTKINMDTIATGEVMPIDNFTQHRLFGKITSNNGRLIISDTRTYLGMDYLTSLCTLPLNYSSSSSLYIDTEDGELRQSLHIIHGSLYYNTSLGPIILSRGILSYPDIRAIYLGVEFNTSLPQQLYRLKANKKHNMAASYNFDRKDDRIDELVIGSFDIVIQIQPSVSFLYGPGDYTVARNLYTEEISYTSNNRFQFSELGEFSIWPAINSYRVGNGKIKFVGNNSIDPSNSDYLAPLIIGSSDGVYTVNYDPSGISLIQSITKTANLPAISEKNVLIDQNLIYVSDKGLMVINNGTVTNITKDYFPEHGNGNFPPANDVYPNYNVLTNSFFGGPNPYILDDIILYLKNALFAFDGRRNNVWCSNPDYDFSLIYNIETGLWSMGTFVFNEVIDFNSTLVRLNEEIYSRFLVKSKTNNSIYILSGESLNTTVYIHILTRPIKLNSPDQYKKIKRLISRCQLYKYSISSAYFTFGLWGKQDLNKNKLNIPLVAYSDTNFPDYSDPNYIRQDIPIGNMMGKFKTFTILQGGFMLPETSIDGFEFEAIPVENNKLR